MNKIVDIKEYPTPYYIVYESKLRRNLELIKSVTDRAGVTIIMAFKANALWKTFSVMREYGVASTASSLNEMWLANEELGKLAHSYCPAYTESTIYKYLQGSSHITFNSLEQCNRFKPHVDKFNDGDKGHTVSCGLRINPMCSVIETDIYNPCRPGSRFHNCPSGLKASTSMHCANQLPTTSKKYLLPWKSNSDNTCHASSGSTWVAAIS